MEGFQETDRLMTSNREQQEIEENGPWSPNSYHNFEMKDDSVSQNNQESYNVYDSGRNNGQLESQDMFNIVHSNHAAETEDNSSVNLEDSDVVCGVYEIGRDCLEVEQEIVQKLNDIKLLQENAKLLKAEIEEKQRILEISKVELLTEQDNYDDVQKKLNDEIELITAIGLQQQALNTQTKHLLEQKFKVNQLIENFKAEFSVIKIDSDKIVQMYEEKHKELETVLQTFANMKIEIENNKLILNEKNHNKEKQLKMKIYEVKHMYENLKVKYYQKIAVLDYLKYKENEEWSKCAKLESELKCIQENECKQIILEENAYSDLEEKERTINDELLELQQEVENDNLKLQQLVQHKNDVQSQVDNLLQEEAALLQKCEEINKLILSKNLQIEELKQTYSKESGKEDNSKLEQIIEDLEQKKREILQNNNEVTNSITEANKRYKDLTLVMEDKCKEQTLLMEVKTNLDSNKSILIEQFEELKERTKNHSDDLENQKSTFNSELEALQVKITEVNCEIESLLKTADKKSCDVLNMKQQLQDNRNKVALLHSELDRCNRDTTAKRTQFNSDVAAYNKAINEKEKIKTEAEREIDRRLTLQSEIELLKGELQVLDCKKRNELKALKDKCQSELQTKQEELKTKKNELEAKQKEKKKTVSDLQEEIVDEQKNELHLVKAIQKLTFISDTNKRELVTLKNVIRTLDEKLHTIAQAVTNSMKDKESIICTQSTAVSGGMGPPKTGREQKKTPAYEDDSSSSGVSMHDNDTTWKKKVLMKQQMKQNTQILTSYSISSQVSQAAKLSASASVDEEMKLKETPKAAAAMKNTPKKTTPRKQPKIPAKKIKTSN